MKITIPYLNFTQSFKNTFKILSANIYIQILSVMSAPVLTRLFLPSSFGEFQLFTSILYMIGPVSCLSYDSAIVLPKEDKISRDIFALSIIISTIISVLSFIILFFLYFNNLLSVNLKYWWLLPISIFLEGAILLINDWNTRHKEFGVLSKRKSISSTLGLVVKLLAGIAFLANSLGLIFSTIVEKLSFIIIGYKTLKRPKNNINVEQDVRKYWNVLKRYKRFPLYSAPTTFINNLGSQIPVFFFSALFNTTIIGYFSLGQRMLSLPLSLMGDSLSRVFFQKITEKKNMEKSISPIIIKAENGLISLSLLPFILLGFWGKEIFRIFFGSDWIVAGEFVQILVPFFFLQFCLSPLSRIVTTFEKQKEALIINTVQIVIKFIGLVIGYYIFMNPNGTLIAFSISSCISIIIYAIYFFKISNTSFLKIFFNARLSLILSIISVVFNVLIKIFIVNQETIVVFMIVNILVYYLILFQHDANIKEIIHG